jgi:hypothetical protein
MAELESQQTNVPIPSESVSDGEANGIEAVLTNEARTPSDSDDDRPDHRISVIPMPRREIARLHGTFRLSELPRHKPSVVFDASRQLRDTDDE